MNESTIQCPKCGAEFELTDALTGRIREHLKTELEASVARREKAISEKASLIKKQEEEVALAKEEMDERVENLLKKRMSEVESRAAKKAETRFADQLQEMESTLKERESALEAFRKQELELRKKSRELDERSKTMELELARKLDKEREALRQEAAKKTADEFGGRLRELEESVKEKDQRIQSFQEKELELRKKQRQLEEAKEAAELEIERKLDEERAKIREEAGKKAAEDHRLKDLEKDKVISDLKSSLEDMKRKAEQGSMETQGEVLEQDFEAQLKSFFVHDDIQPVPKGVRGADLIQSIKTPLGHDCGVLLWETKNTKAWSSQWVPKLKEDMRDIKADQAIIVSVVLPDGISRFGQHEGVWVSDPLSAIPLAAALRQQYVAVARERTAATGKGEKMEMLYQYLAGSEFKQKIEGIVEAFTSMQDQLNQERRAMEKHWKQRGKQIEGVIKNTVGLYGDMQGIIGGQIPSIPALELEAGEEQLLEESSPDDSK